MIKIKSFPHALTSLLLCFSCVSYATQDENNTLILTIHNHTAQTLYLDHIESANPGNIFSVPDEIKPDSDVRVSAIKNLENDVFAHVIYKTNNGRPSTLTILDQEQIHFGQPIFNFSSDKMKSIILSKTRNKNVGPRFLTYVSAEIEVLDK